MRIVVFGLSITSSWGNGHATTYRALLHQLHRAGHDLLFLERDQPWYADNRDLPQPIFCDTQIYRSFGELKRRFSEEIRQADCIVIGSYVPNGIVIAEWILHLSSGVTAFYDIDTPITLARLATGECDYISRALIPKFDLYLSFTGGPTLQRIEWEFGARRARALYCSVDIRSYFPEQAPKKWTLGYLGTFSRDRQAVLEELLIGPARQLTQESFIVAGPQYPRNIRWPENVKRVQHLEPATHRAFYNAQRFTLNITRTEMVRAGWSPSVRLFEAAACATPIITDEWRGLRDIFEPGREVLVARTSNDVVRILRAMPPNEASAIGRRARERVLEKHTAAHRAAQLIEFIESAMERQAAGSDKRIELEGVTR